LTKAIGSATGSGHAAAFTYLFHYVKLYTVFGYRPAELTSNDYRAFPSILNYRNRIAYRSSVDYSLAAILRLVLSTALSGTNGALHVYAVLDKSVAPAQTESSLFGMMKQEPISGVASNGHLSGYHGCAATDNSLMTPTTSATAAATMMMNMQEKNYLVDDRGLLNETVFSRAGPGGIQPPQMTRVNGLRVNYANRGGTIRSYHCRLCRKVNSTIFQLFAFKTFHVIILGK